MKRSPQISWKVYLSVGSCVLCCMIAFWVLLPSPASVASAKGIENPHIPTGCQVYQQDFSIQGTKGDRTPTLTKSDGCDGAVWVQFTKLPPYQMNALVCTTGEPLTSGCKSQRGWFTPIPFTNTSLQQADTIDANTQFFVMYTAYDASATPGHGHIVVYY